MSSRRILITGVSSPWGGRLAQQLERDPLVEALVGVDVEDPRHELLRTEFVRLDLDPTLMRRILTAAAIDTVIDTRCHHDPLVVSPGRARQVNVEGTRKLLEACAAPELRLRKLIFKASAQRYGNDPADPQFFTEAMDADVRPRTAIERDLADAEAAVSAFAAAHPRTVVTVLRFSDELGPEVRSSPLSLLSLPVVPAILGFDPRCQFIHQDDVIAALVHAAGADLPGAYNAAADGVLALSEVVALLGKALLPVLPPWGTILAAAQLRRLGLQIPLELLRSLRTGRGLDNRRLKASGFAFRYTTRETVLKLRAHQRLRGLLGSGQGGYRYERDVEEFLRWSPSVQAPTLAMGGEDRLSSGLPEGELIELIGSLDAPALLSLREYEAGHGRRERILRELDRRLTRHGAPPRA